MTSAAAESDSRRYLPGPIDLRHPHAGGRPSVPAGNSPPSVGQRHLEGDDLAAEPRVAIQDDVPIRTTVRQAAKALNIRRGAGFQPNATYFSTTAQSGQPQPSASVSGPCSTPGGVSLRLAAGCPAGPLAGHPAGAQEAHQGVGLRSRGTAPQRISGIALKARARADVSSRPEPAKRKGESCLMAFRMGRARQTRAKNGPAPPSVLLTDRCSTAGVTAGLATCQRSAGWPRSHIYSLCSSHRFRQQPARLRL